MQVFPCVCIISAEPFFPRKSGLMINSTHAWSLLKHLTRYMRFRLKGNSSVILMIKTCKREGYKDLGGSLSSWRSIDYQDLGALIFLWSYANIQLFWLLKVACLPTLRKYKRNHFTFIYFSHWILTLCTCKLILFPR